MDVTREADPLPPHLSKRDSSLTDTTHPPAASSAATPASSTSPLAVLLRVLSNPTDLTFVKDYTTPDFTYVSLNYVNLELKQVLPWAGTSRGTEALVQTFIDVSRYWTVDDFQIQDSFENNEAAAVFGTFTYTSNTLGKTVTSPFAVLARGENGKLSYVQFMEDTFATVRSFRESGEYHIRANPDGSHQHLRLDIASVKEGRISGGAGLQGGLRKPTVQIYARFRVHGASSCFSSRQFAYLRLPRRIPAGVNVQAVMGAWGCCNRTMPGLHPQPNLRHLGLSGCRSASLLDPRSRTAGAAIAAENGANDNEPIFGWTTKKRTAHYIKQRAAEALPSPE